MIRWQELDTPVSKSSQRRWRRDCCPYARREPDGTCLGLDNGEDDEPCDICKVCDKLGGEVDDV
jgi:hypothetical protein